MSYQLPYYGTWTKYTPVIPKFYWDVYSAEQRIKEICLILDKSLHYLDEIVSAQNNINNNTDKQLEMLEKLTTAMNENIEEIQKALNELTLGRLLMYDPTQGKYTDSKETTRNMFRELAVFGARVNQMATLTTAQAAATTNLEMAVIGNKTVFGNPEPRVTPIN